MSEPENWRQILTPKVADQIDHITGAFHDDGAEIGVVTSGGGISHIHAEGQILVRDEHLAAIREILRQPLHPHLVRRITSGVVLLTLAERVDGHQAPTVASALSRIDELIGQGNATPDHVITVAGGISMCPATEPQAAYPDVEPFPAPAQSNDGAGVLIYVADTGLLKGACESHPWLHGVTGEPDPLPARTKDGTQTIPPYTGHGTFVAGVIRCVAPAADVYVSKIFKTAGSALESDLVADLEGALRQGVDIFNLSFSTVTRADLPLVAFDAWLRKLHIYKGVVCVTAAGNDSGRRPAWPAALPQMVAVGALTADGTGLARFSNYGGWVDVYAPGRDHVNAYASGTYTYHERPFKGLTADFYGMAKWSGTSFSTPIVTGLIAARMSRTGENGKQAAQAVLAEARSHAIPGIGAVLMPR